MTNSVTRNTIRRSQCDHTVDICNYEVLFRKYDFYFPFIIVCFYVCFYVFRYFRLFVEYWACSQLRHQCMAKKETAKRADFYLLYVDGAIGSKFVHFTAYELKCWRPRCTSVENRTKMWKKYMKTNASSKINTTDAIPRQRQRSHFARYYQTK